MICLWCLLGALAWVLLALVLALIVCAGIRHADRAEGQDAPDAPADLFPRSRD